MCNCGSRNQRLAAARPRAGEIVGTGDARPSGAETVEFMYVGRSALTAIGPFTGATYRFHQPNACVHVDTRDAASLAQVPVLRRMSR